MNSSRATPGRGGYLLRIMSWIKSKTQNKYFVSLTVLISALLVLAFAYTAKNFAGMLVGLLLMQVSLLPALGATNLLILVCAVTLSLSLAELSIDLFSNNNKSAYRATKYSPDSDYGKGSYFFFGSDLGYQARPGRYTSKKLSADGDVVYDVAYTIGEDGFRITDLSNSNMRIRINFFGCSFTFGEGLNDKETLPYFLHALDDGISVKNFGFHGYGVHQALRILESRRDTKGDVNFLLTMPWHAERSACIPDYSRGTPRYVLSADGQLRLDGTCDNQSGQEYSLITRTLLLHHSRIYQLIRESVLPETKDWQMELYLAIIQEIKNLSHARNQRFVVGFIEADNTWVDRKYSNAKIVERITEMGIDVIDLTLGQSKDYYIHQVDRHPSAMANLARAKLLREYLRGENKALSGESS